MQGLSAVYPSATIARTWDQATPTPAAGSNVEDALHDAFLAMGSFVNHHPLNDGNGRVGRGLFQGALARAVGLSCPMLGLTPFLLFQRQDVLRGWFTLGKDGDWTLLVHAYQRAMQGCLDHHLAECR